MSDEEIVSRRLNERFELAKRTSDFVGMITRLAFLSLLVSFLWNTAEETESVLSICYEIAAFFLLGLTLFFIARVVRLMDVYEVHIFENSFVWLNGGRLKVFKSLLRAIIYFAMFPVIIGLVGGSMIYGDKLAERLHIEQHDPMR